MDYTKCPFCKHLFYYISKSKEIECPNCWETFKLTVQEKSKK